MAATPISNSCHRLMQSKKEISFDTKQPNTLEPKQHKALAINQHSMLIKSDQLAVRQPNA